MVAMSSIRLMITRVTFAISIVFFVCIVAHGQPTRADRFSDAYFAGIVEAVLDLEFNDPTSEIRLAQLKAISSENIEFIEPSRLSKRGFGLVTPSQINESKKDHVVNYLRFGKIYFRGSVAVIVLSRITEGKPCFSGPFSHQWRYTYEVHQTPDGWSAQLMKRPGLWVPFNRGINTANQHK
jgi:hypothetical protein